MISSPSVTVISTRWNNSVQVLSASSGLSKHASQFMLYGYGLRSPWQNILSVSPAYVPLKVLQHHTAWPCSSLFFLFTITWLTVRKHFHLDYIHLHNHVQPWPLISEHQEYTWHKDYSAGIALPVSSRSFAPAHCFCSWISVCGETFRVCRPIFVRFHFLRIVQVKNFLPLRELSYLLILFVCLKNLLVLPLILPADCFTPGLLALCADYCFVFSPGVAKTLDEVPLPLTARGNNTDGNADH